MGEGRHEWYGPEYFREPATHVAAAIQRPQAQDPARWMSGVINAYLRDAGITKAARAKGAPDDR